MEETINIATFMFSKFAQDGNSGSKYKTVSSEKREGPWFPQWYKFLLPGTTPREGSWGVRTDPFQGKPYLFTERSPSCTLGLLVTLWKGPIAGAQPFTRGIIYLHGNALCGSFLWKGFQMDRLLIAQKVFKPIKQFREFPEESKPKTGEQLEAWCSYPEVWLFGAESELCYQGQIPMTIIISCLRSTASEHLASPFLIECSKTSQGADGGAALKLSNNQLFF